MCHRDRAARFALVVVVAALVAGGCGSGDAAESGSAAGVPTPGPVTETVTATPLPTATAVPLPAWSFGDAVESRAEVDDTEPGVGEPDPGADSVEAGGVLADVPAEPSFADGDEDVDGQEPEGQDPCSLVTQDEWAAWLDSPPSETSVLWLEEGTACGFIDRDDTVRLALSVIELDGPWLPPEVTASTIVLTGGQSALWAKGYPAPESSTLVVETDSGAQLVIEISARGRGGDRDLGAAAAAFAELALGRIP